MRLRYTDRVVLRQRAIRESLYVAGGVMLSLLLVRMFGTVVWALVREVL